MKQTSSAITFLMAQYRAIFKHAYVKGLAAAVILTAGLAAGQAQAADQTTWGDSWAEPSDLVSVSSGSIETSGDKFTNKFEVTGSVNVSGNGRLIVKDSMTLNNATLTVSGTTNGKGIFGMNVDPTGKPTSEGDGKALFSGDTVTELTATNSTIKIDGTEQAILFSNVTLTDTDVTIASGSGIGAEDGGTKNVDGRGQLVIKGGNYKLADSAWLYGEDVSITDTEISVSGGTITMSGDTFSGGTNDIYAQSSGVMNFDGTLNIASGAAARLGGGTVNLTGTINNSGTLVLGTAAGQTFNIQDGAAFTHEGKGYIYSQSDIVMTGGSLTLKDGFGIAGTTPVSGNGLGTGVADFTATGGTIDVGDADIAMLNVTLGGDVEVTLTGSSGSNATWKDNSHIDAALEETTGEGGTFTVQDNASIEMNDGSLLTAMYFNLNGGHITMQGSEDGNNANASGTAIIRAFPDAVINLNGGAIDITKDKAGIIRGGDINLTGSTITNNGTLTIGGLLSNANGSGTNTVAGAGYFDMTGGTLINANGATLNLGLYNSTTQINNLGSTFTIAGGTFTNSTGATVNVASGSNLTLTGTTTVAPTISNSGTISVTSGGKLTTTGTVTVGGTGTISLASGSTATLGGENVVLNGILDVASGASASITGKVTFNGDGKADTAVDLKVANKDNFTLATGGSLTIQDVAQTIGLTHTYGESGGTFAVSGGTFKGLNTTSAGTLYLDMVGVIKDASGAAITSMTQTEAEQYAAKLRAALGSGENFLLNLQGITINLGKEVDNALSSGNNSVDYGLVEDALASGLENDQLVNTSVNVSGTTAVQGSIGQITTDSNTIYAAGDQLKLNGYVPNSGDASPVLTQQGSGASATVAGIEMKAGSDVQANITEGFIGEVTTSAAGTGTFTVTAGSTVSVVQTGTSVSSLSADTAAPVGDIGSASTKINTVQATGSLTAGDVSRLTPT